LPDINIEYTNVGAFPFLRGLNAHYHIMNEDDYIVALEQIREQGGV